MTKHEAKKLYARTEELFKELTATLYGTKVGLEAADIPDLVDAGYLMRELENLADTIRKDAAKRKKLIGSLLAVRFASETLKLGEPLKLAGELATATADLSSRPVLPKRGSDAYYALLDWLGVPKETAKEQILDFSWRKMHDLVMERMEAGEEVPPGVGTYDDPTCTFRKKPTK